MGASEILAQLQQSTPSASSILSEIQSAPRLSDPEAPLSTNPRLRKIQVEARIAQEQAMVGEQNVQTAKETGAAIAGVLASTLIPGGPALSLSSRLPQILAALGARGGLGALGGAVGGGVQAGLSGGDVGEAAFRGAAFGAPIGAASTLLRPAGQVALRELPSVGGVPSKIQGLVPSITGPLSNPASRAPLLAQQKAEAAARIEADNIAKRKTLESLEPRPVQLESGLGVRRLGKEPATSRIEPRPVKLDDELISAEAGPNSFRGKSIEERFALPDERSIEAAERLGSDIRREVVFEDFAKRSGMDVRDLKDIVADPSPIKLAAALTRHGVTIQDVNALRASLPQPGLPEPAPAFGQTSPIISGGVPLEIERIERTGLLGNRILKPEPLPEPIRTPSPAVLKRSEKQVFDAIAKKAGRPVIARAIGAAERAGYSIREARLAAAEGFIGRRFKSFNDLTDDEAARVTGFFDAMADRGRAGDLIADSAVGTRSLLTKAIDADIAGSGEVLSEIANKRHYITTAGVSHLRKMGSAGNRAADLLEQYRANWYTRTGREAEILRRIEGRKHLGLSRNISSKEAEELMGVLENTAPSTPKLAKAADDLSDLYDRYATEIEAFEAKGTPLLTENPRTGQLHPFRRRNSYAPHYRTRESIGKIKNPVERSDAMKRFRKLGRAHQSSNVRFGRVLDSADGYERNALKATAMYIERNAGPLEWAKIFGPDNRVAKNLIEQIRNEAGPDAANAAQRIFESMGNPMLRERSALANVLTDLAGPMFLTTAGVLQPTQLVAVAAREGFFNTFKSLARLMVSPAARSAARETGASLRSSLDLMLPRGPGSIGLSSFWAKAIGAKGLDRFSRHTGALAAQLRAMDVAKQLARGKMTPKNLIDAKRLGLDPEEIRKLGGVLTKEQLNEAGLRGSISTNFLSDALSLPGLMDHPWGKVLTLYKTFAVNAGRFSKDLLKDAAAGHRAPLIRFLLASPPASIAFGEFLRSWRGKEPPDNIFLRVAEDMLYVNQIGVFVDLLYAAGTSNQAALEALIGPVFAEMGGTASDLTTGIANLLQGEDDPFKALKRRVVNRTLRRVPFKGKELAEEALE